MCGCCVPGLKPWAWRRVIVAQASLDRDAQAGGFADPTGDAEVLLAGAFEVLEVLAEGGLVELGEELGVGGGVDAADLVDELTFIHGVFTFRFGVADV